METPLNGIESNETTTSSNYTTKETNESTTFRDDFTSRGDNVTTMSGDISDYVYKITPAPDEFANQVDKITDITNYVPKETTTATPFSDENLLGRTNKVTDTYSSTQTVPEEDTNSTVVENTTVRYWSHTENTTDGQYTTELKIIPEYTVESENTTTQPTLNIENITAEQFSVSSGLMSANRTTWKYFNSETTSSTKHITEDYTRLLGVDTTKLPTDNAENVEITEQTDDLDGTTSEVFFVSVENYTTEPSINPETTTTPEYPSKYRNDTVTENNAQNNKTADFGITTVISENTTTGHTILESSVTNSTWESGFTDMENSTAKIIATGPENTKTKHIQDVTTVARYTDTTKENAMVKHTDSAELTTVSNHTVNLNTTTTTDNSVSEENVTRGDDTRNQHNTPTDGYFFNGENITMAANKDNIITTEQWEKSEVTDYTADVKPTPGLINTENVEIFTTFDSSIDQENTDFADNLTDDITAEATVNPQNTGNTQQPTNHSENSTVAGFTIRLENISTDSESTSNPVKGLSTEPENVASGIFTDGSVKTKVTTPPTDFGGVRDGDHSDSTKIVSAAHEVMTTAANIGISLYNYTSESLNLNLSTKNTTNQPNFNSNTVDLSTIHSYNSTSTTMEDFDTGTHGEKRSTSSFSNLSDNTTLSDSITYSSINQTSYERNTLKDTMETSKRNSTLVSWDDENKTIINELTTEAVISAGKVTKDTNKLLQESLTDFFLNETTTAVPTYKITEMTKFIRKEGVMETSSGTQRIQETSTEQISSTVIKTSMLFVETTEVSVTAAVTPTVNSDSLITETTPDDEDGISLSSSVNINEMFSKTISPTYLQTSLESSRGHEDTPDDVASVSPNDVDILTQNNTETVTLNDVKTNTQNDIKLTTPNNDENVTPHNTETISTNNYNTVIPNDVGSVTPNNVETFRLKDASTVIQEDVTDVTETVTPENTEIVTTNSDFPNDVSQNNTDGATKTFTPNYVVNFTDAASVTPGDTDTLTPDDVEIFRPNDATQNDIATPTPRDNHTDTFTSNNVAPVTTNYVATITQKGVAAVTANDSKTANSIDASTDNPEDVKIVTLNNDETTSSNVTIITKDIFSRSIVTEIDDETFKPNDISTAGPEKVSTVTPNDFSSVTPNYDATVTPCDVETVTHHNTESVATYYDGYVTPNDVASVTSDNVYFETATSNAFETVGLSSIEPGKEITSVVFASRKESFTTEATTTVYSSDNLTFAEESTFQQDNASDSSTGTTTMQGKTPISNIDRNTTVLPVSFDNGNGEHTTWGAILTPSLVS